MVKINDNKHVTKNGVVKNNPKKYNTIIKAQFLDSTLPIPVLPPKIKVEADALFDELNSDYEEPFEMTRQGVVYRWKGDMWHSDIYAVVNAQFKNSKFKSVVHDYVYRKLVREGFYIHT